MNYYPLYLNLKGCLVLLVGGGDVAQQKIERLLCSSARVRVVAPEATSEIQRLSRDGKIQWFKRAYRSSDVNEARLVIGATNDPALQKRIAKDARAGGIWVNIVDVPALCDFIAPAVFRRGNLQIAISTGGAAPALAKHLRKKFGTLIGEEYESFVALTKALRPEILKLSTERKSAFWKKTVRESFFKEIKRHGIARARKRMKAWMHAK